MRGTTSENILKVNVLYPNPTTVYFTVKLFKPLNNATVMLTDASVKVISEKTESGEV